MCYIFKGYLSASEAFLYSDCKAFISYQHPTASPPLRGESPSPLTAGRSNARLDFRTYNPVNVTSKFFFLSYHLTLSIVERKTTIIPVYSIGAPDRQRLQAIVKARLPASPFPSLSLSHTLPQQWARATYSSP